MVAWMPPTGILSPGEAMRRLLRLVERKKKTFVFSLVRRVREDLVQPLPGSSTVANNRAGRVVAGPELRFSRFRRHTIQRQQTDRRTVER